MKGKTFFIAILCVVLVIVAPLFALLYNTEEEVVEPVPVLTAPTEPYKFKVKNPTAWGPIAKDNLEPYDEKKHK
jgi:hypothetical protein